MVRAQYHFRKSEHGLLAWDVRKLVAGTVALLPEKIPLACIGELDECFWFELGGAVPSCRQIAEHARLIDDADLKYPIIVDPDGRVMDGMHRVCKASNQGLDFICAFRLPELPEPDFVGVAPENLPYDPDTKSLQLPCEP